MWGICDSRQDILGQQTANVCWPNENRAPTSPMGCPSGGHVKIYLPMGLILRALLTARAFGLGRAAQKIENLHSGGLGCPFLNGLRLWRVRHPIRTLMRQFHVVADSVDLTIDDIVDRFCVRMARLTRTRLSNYFLIQN